MFYNILKGTLDEIEKKTEAVDAATKAWASDTDTAITDDDYGPDVVNVVLPLKLYEISINHRVLAELGELSHFILSTMSKHNLTIEDIEEVTGLSVTQIRPVIDRLKALKFITDSEKGLTETGKRIAYILENIHDKSFCLYIDQNYSDWNNDWFIVLEGSDSLQDISKSCFLVPLPREVRSNHVEDCFKQNQRFQKNHLEILPRILPAFEKLIVESNAIWEQEWDITFWSKPSNKNMGIPVELQLKEFKSSQEQHNNKTEKPENTHPKKTLRLYTELLRLNVRFTLPTGIDFGEFQEPQTMSFVYSDNDQRIYDAINFETDPDNDKRLYTEECLDEKQSALNLLAHSITFIDDDTQLYSRQNNFDKGWQLHEYTYEEVINCISGAEIMRIKA